MTHIEELQMIQEFSQNVKGDETMRLQKEIIAMEMSLGIIKRSQKEEMTEHERKKSVKGYIWKSGRGIESKKNYADKILKSHQQNRKKKKMKKGKMAKKKHASTSSIGTTSTTSTSVAIQSDTPNASRVESICDFIPRQIKKCCYHCFTLFILSEHTIQREERYFCQNDCLSEYIKSTLITCANNKCQTQFARSDGSRFHGQWLCKSHFKEYCINEMESNIYNA